MPRSSAAPVTTRYLAPEEASADSESLFQAVPQLEGKPPFKVSYPWITPEKAKEWLRVSDSDPAFRQRPLALGQVRRWRTLLRTDRFVHYLPNGPMCTDPDGMLLNAKHRLTAIADSENGAGLVLFSEVPRWMFKYFDTGKNRTIKDVFHIGAREVTPQTPSAMRLGMRYEEFLQGVRSAHGWRHWSTVSDEHNDIDSFLARRQEMQDWVGVGMKVQRDARLMAPAVMAFYFYQSLAWPEGASEVEQFCTSLMTGEMLAPQSPALLLREWSRDCWYNKDKIFSKREVHFMLLMRCFEQYINGSRIPALRWAYGNPMPMPYHPKGHDVAVKNARLALEELDKEAAGVR